MIMPLAKKIVTYTADEIAVRIKDAYDDVLRKLRARGFNVKGWVDVSGKEAKINEVDGKSIEVRFKAVSAGEYTYTYSGVQATLHRYGRGSSRNDVVRYKNGKFDALKMAKYIMDHVEAVKQGEKHTKVIEKVTNKTEADVKVLRETFGLKEYSGPAQLEVHKTNTWSVTLKLHLTSDAEARLALGALNPHGLLKKT
jgi:hypothetical protein